MRIYILTYIINKIINDYNDYDEFKLFIKESQMCYFYRKYKFIILDDDKNILNFNNINDDNDDNDDFNDTLIKININNDNIEINNYKLFYTPGIIKIKDDIMTIIKKIFNSNADFGEKYFKYYCKYIDNKIYNYYHLQSKKIRFNDDYIEKFNYIMKISEKLLKLDHSI